MDKDSMVYIQKFELRVPVIIIVNPSATYRLNPFLHSFSGHGLR